MPRPRCCAGPAADRRRSASWCSRHSAAGVTSAPRTSSSTRAPASLHQRIDGLPRPRRPGGRGDRAADRPSRRVPALRAHPRAPAPPRRVPGVRSGRAPPRRRARRDGAQARRRHRLRAQPRPRDHPSRALPRLPRGRRTGLSGGRVRWTDPTCVSVRICKRLAKRARRRRWDVMARGRLSRWTRAQGRRGRTGLALLAVAALAPAIVGCAAEDTAGADGGKLQVATTVAPDHEHRREHRRRPGRDQRHRPGGHEHPHVRAHAERRRAALDGRRGLRQRPEARGARPWSSPSRT